MEPQEPIVEYQRPTQDNVHVGDTLYYIFGGNVRELKIEEIRDFACEGKDKVVTSNSPYSKSIIYTTKGELLVGKDVSQLELELVEAELAKEK